MTTRVSRTESGSGNYFLVSPDLAGTHRAGRTRLVEPELEVLAAENLNTLPGSQPADCQVNSLPAQAGLSGLTTAAFETSRLLAQVAGGSDQLLVGEVVQLGVNSDSDRLDRMPLVTSETVENMEKLDDQST